MNTVYDIQADEDYTYGAAHGSRAARDPNGSRTYSKPSAIPGSVAFQASYLEGHRDGWNEARESLAEMAAG